MIVYENEVCYVEQDYRGFSIYLKHPTDKKVLQSYDLQEAVAKCDKLTAAIEAAEQDMPTEDAIAQVKEFSYLYL